MQPSVGGTPQRYTCKPAIRMSGACSVLGTLSHTAPSRALLVVDLAQSFKFVLLRFFGLHEPLQRGLPLAWYDTACDLVMGPGSDQTTTWKVLPHIKRVLPSLLEKSRPHSLLSLSASPSILCTGLSSSVNNFCSTVAQQKTSTWTYRSWVRLQCLSETFHKRETKVRCS